MDKKYKNIGKFSFYFGLAGAALLSAIGYERFIFNYLIVFAIFSAISVASLFFISLQSLVGAKWSRPLENICLQLGRFLPYSFAALLPVLADLMFFHELFASYESAGGPAGAEAAFYLDKWFLSARLIFYVLVWNILYFALKKAAKEKKVKSGRFYALSIIAYVLTVSFAGVDLLAALEKGWHSSIFGMYFFSGSYVAALSIISLLALAVRRGSSGVGVGPWQLENLAKMIFAFNIFFS